MSPEFEQIFRQSHDGVLIAQPDGRILHANAAACVAFGRSESELAATELVALADDSASLHALLDQRDRGEVVRAELTFQRADGSTFPAECSSATYATADATLRCIIVRDLSYRRTMEHALEDVESHHRSFFDGAHEAVAFVTPRVIDNQRTWCIVDANLAMQRLVRRDHLQGVPLRDVIGALADERIPVFERVLVSGEPEEHETYAVGGREAVLRVFRQSASVLCAALLDVTDRRRAERELRALTQHAEHQAEELHAILDTVPAGIFIARDTTGQRIQINRFAARMLRLPGDRALTDVSDVSTLRRHVHSMRNGVPMREEDGVLLRAARDGVSTDDAEIDIRFDDGDVRHLLGNAYPLLDTGGIPRGAVASFTDVTALVSSKRALASTLAEFNAFMAATPALQWIKDTAGRLVYVNAAFQQRIGLPLEALHGRTAQQLRPELDGSALKEAERRVLESGEPSTSVEQYPDPNDGARRWWNITRFRITSPDGSHQLGNVAIDVTDQQQTLEALRLSEARAVRAQRELQDALETTRRTEAQLRQAQKMDAVGRLAGGIAHDFNNLLTVILGQAELLQGDLQRDPLSESVNEIRAAGQRAATLTRQLLAFSRKQALEPRVLSINTVLSGMQQMIERLIGESIDVALLLQSDLQHCRVDPGQLEQVVLNLVVNARDAMPDGGRLTIETANVLLDDDYRASHPDSQSGPHVMLSVSDTGTGMTPEVRANLFEPFFTTKREGEGTGLGLSTVYGIVKQSGGNIWVYSELAHGSTFKVYFPTVTGAEDALPPKLVSLSSFHGTETILLAEDDARVRRTVTSMLRRAGYHVLEAANGGEALLICEQFGGSISLLITDVVMPRMNGRQLAERLREVRPQMPVLFVSGYTANVVVHHGVVDAGVNFLQKPLTAEALLPKVREVLDAKGSTARA